ncbi:hypothetical protein P9H28_03020 [Paenibacillus barengoltzii]|uniref:hypothetical protein n=1 Tax=Paenibacillus barengoltzii TaxID=343517 RepID=UPI002DBC0D71|nr:hypothetical protein [Paenibacillus barengoltzii]MEC2343080.1 hypothetical protein [Paenibacillus barengoltzii]
MATKIALGSLCLKGVIGMRIIGGFLLGKSGLRVSDIALVTMIFGDLRWGWCKLFEGRNDDPRIIGGVSASIQNKSDFGKSQMGIFSEDLVLLIKLFLSRRK